MKIKTLLLSVFMAGGLWISYLSSCEIMKFFHQARSKGSAELMYICNVGTQLRVSALLGSIAENEEIIKVNAQAQRSLCTCHCS